MKTLFVFDTVLIEDEKKDFYGMTLTYDFFKSRYLSFCNEMIITTRSKNKDDVVGNIDGYRITNGENINVMPIKGYKDIPDWIKQKKYIQREMDSIVEKSDNLIIRMPSVLGMFACISANKFKKPYVIEMVACPWDGYLNHARFGGKILAPIMLFNTKKYLKQAPNVLYVTNDFLQNRYPTDGNSIGCSDVVLGEVSKNILEKRLKHIRKMDLNEPLKLVTVASVQLKYKGQEFVMKAMEELKKSNVKCEYYLIGGGDNSRLKKFVKELNLEGQVHFLGSVPHCEIFELLKSMDLYLQPSLQEGLPRALIEAMSMAMPAIGSDVGGIPELLDKSYIFPKRDYNRLKEIIESLTIEKLIEQSKINFEISKKYDAIHLKEKRERFYIKALGID